jgi:hypothetical protein
MPWSVGRHISQFNSNTPELLHCIPLCAFAKYLNIKICYNNIISYTYTVLFAAPAYIQYSNVLHGHLLISDSILRI